MLNCQILLKNKSDTLKFASLIKSVISFNTTICLIGDLGAGKTYFSKHLIQLLCSKKINVVSPSYNIVNIYDYTKNNKTEHIWHLDLYRIYDEDEVIELSFEEALNNNLVIIEWANRLHDFYPKSALTIEFIEVKNQANARVVKISSTYKEINEQLQQQLQKIFSYECL